MPEGRDATLRDPDRLQKWPCVTLTRFNKAKCRVLHPGRGNPRYQYRLRGEGMESSPAKKGLGVLGDEKLDMSWQCAAQQANRALGSIPSSVGSRVREGILPLCPSQGRTPGSPASSSGALSTGQTGSCWSGARGGSSNDSRAGTPLL